MSSITGKEQRKGTSLIVEGHLLALLYHPGDMNKKPETHSPPTALTHALTACASRRRRRRTCAVSPCFGAFLQAEKARGGGAPSAILGFSRDEVARLVLKLRDGSWAGD